MIVDDLRGKFHAHITLNTDNHNFICPKSWKTTIIVLSKNNREQKDIMITRHFSLGKNNIHNFDSIIKEIENAANELQQSGHNVIRKKLEHESLPTLPTTLNTYRECHIKIRKPNDVPLNTVDNFVESRNPMEIKDQHSTVFLNARFYKGTIDEIDNIINRAVEKIKVANPACNILEVKKETTVYDTNLLVDKWWA